MKLKAIMKGSLFFLLMVSIFLAIPVLTDSAFLALSEGQADSGLETEPSPSVEITEPTAEPTLDAVTGEPTDVAAEESPESATDVSPETTPEATPEPTLEATPEAALEPIPMIKGVVSLPDDDIAPEGGLLVYVGYRRTDKHFSGQRFEMEAGANSVEYALPLYSDPDLNDLIITSLVPNYLGPDTPYKSTPYTNTQVYYSLSGTVLTAEEADPVALTDNAASGINLTLARFQPSPEGVPATEYSRYQMLGKVTGTISLPNGDVAPDGGIMVYVGYQCADQNYMGQLVQIESGANSVDYTLIVNGDANPDQLFVRAGVSNFIGPDVPQKKTPYSDIDVYYALRGSVLNREQADSIHIINGVASGINLTLSKQHIISGAISLPGGDIAPPEGVEVFVGYPCNGQYYGNTFFIKSGERSVDYMLFVNPDANINNLILKVEVPNFCDAQNRYFVSPYFNLNSYYTASGCVDNEKLAERIGFVDGVASGINIVLKRNAEITGTIYLPQGETAPENGLMVYVGFWCLDGNYTGQEYRMEAGTSSVNYVLHVYGNADYNNLIIQSIIPNYLGGGEKYSKTPYSDMSFFYTSAGTVLQQELAEPVKLVNNRATGVDITLSKNPVFNEAAAREGEGP